MSDLQQLAALALASFETDTRANGSRFLRVRDGSPEWITDMVREAGHDHANIFPDDYRYTYLHDALEALSEGTDPEEVPDVCREQVDVYTGDLLRWLMDGGGSMAYCDDMLTRRMPNETLSDLLMMAQGEERSEVAYEVCQWLLQYREDGE